MYGKVFLIAFAAFTIAQAASGSRLFHQRDALDDAFEVAQKYYKNLNKTFINLSGKLNFTLGFYWNTANTSSAEYASLLHGQIDEAIKYYETESVDVSQCLKKKHRIGAIYEDYVNQVAKATNGTAFEHALANQYYLRITGEILKAGRRAEEICTQFANQADVAGCRKIVSKRMSDDFNIWEARMRKVKNSAELAIYNFRNYYPISDIVSVVKYDVKASQIVESIIECMSELHAKTFGSAV